MKIIRNIIVSDVEPDNPNELWLDTKTMSFKYQGSIITALQNSSNMLPTLDNKALSDYLNVEFEKNPDSNQEILISNYVDNLFKSNGVTIPEGMKYEMNSMSELYFNSSYDSNTPVKVKVEANTEEGFYFSTELSASWSISYSDGVTLSRGGSNKIELYKIGELVNETISTFTFNTNNPEQSTDDLKKWLSKYNLDTYRIGTVHIGSSYVSNNKGLKATVIQSDITVTYLGDNLYSLQQLE